MPVLRLLQQAIAKSYPRLATLDKPASAQNLEALEKVVGFALPEDLVALWRWHGGAEGFFTDKDTDDSAPGWDLDSESAKGPELARARVAKAVALEALGKKAAAKKSWHAASKANAKVAKFWRAFSGM
jgi:cell wall assembly regulator SMI1